MSAGITERDRQTGLNQAWHGKTVIVDNVTRDNSMPYEVIESPIYYRIPDDRVSGQDQLIGVKESFIEAEGMKQLIASDDFKPIGAPYGKSYKPTSISGFWDVIEQSLGGIDYKVVSAGSLDDRGKIFASIKLHDGFRVGDREFKDYITILDSFDKTTSFKALYSSVCVVCANTYAQVLSSGSTVGSAKHTANVDNNIKRLVDSIQKFTQVSNQNMNRLANAHASECSKDEAKAWLMGVENRNLKNKAHGLTNGIIQKNARMTELFLHGRGNSGRTRLDAFSAFTEFHTHESSNRVDSNAQAYTSEWGSSARAKALALDSLQNNWDQTVRDGEQLLQAWA